MVVVFKKKCLGFKKGVRHFIYISKRAIKIYGRGLLLLLLSTLCAVVPHHRNPVQRDDDDDDENDDDDDGKSTPL